MMVLLAHVTFGFWDHFYYSEIILGAIAQAVANLGTYGVELFFVISGYVITSSCLKYSPREFTGRRFWRLYPLFALFTLVYFLLNLVTQYEPSKLNLDLLIYNLLFLELFIGTPALTPNAWSITFEVWYYIATYGLLWFLLRSESRWRALGAIGFLALAGYLITAYEITLYFVGGVFLYFSHKKLGAICTPSQSTGIALIALVVVIAIASSTDFPTTTYFEVPGMQLAALALLAGTLAFTQAALTGNGVFARLLSSTALRFLGTISYSLYLLHPYTYIVTREGARYLGINTYPWQVTFGPWLVANIGLALGLSWIVHKMVEVGPYKLVYGSKIYRDHKRDGLPRDEPATATDRRSD